MIATITKMTGGVSHKRVVLLLFFGNCRTLGTRQR
jgi:hypothetical protein